MNPVSIFYKHLKVLFKSCSYWVTKYWNLCHFWPNSMTLNDSASITTVWLIWTFSMMTCNNKEIWRRKIISLSYWIQHLRTGENSSVQLLSCVQFFATPPNGAHQASLSITNSWSPPKPMSIESVMPSNHLILCCPLLLPSIFPSIRVFPNESALCIRWPKYWSFSFISPSNEHPGLISFRMDWLDLDWIDSL